MVGAWQDIGRISADRNFKSSTIESTSHGIWGFQEKETMSFHRMYAPVDANLEKVKKRGESSVMYVRLAFGQQPAAYVLCPFWSAWIPLGFLSGSL
jgi:hypothetical protein